MAIDKNSAAYKSILAKWYTDAEIEQMYNEVNSGKSAKDAIASMNAQKANPTTNTSNTNRNIAKPEYQWTGTTNAKTSSYTNQWAGNYTYNSKTGYYEKTWSQTNNQTSNNSSVNSPYQNQWAGNYTYNQNTGYYEKQGQTAVSSSMDSTKKAWDNLSIQEQQQKLKDNPSLKDAIIKKWWTIKSNYENQWEWNYKYNPETWYYEKQGQTSGWLDYQDNSPERLQQIYDNLNRYRITNPELFDNWETFSNFFINWLNRSPEQLEVLRNYYDSVKKYNGYDNLSPNTVWNLIAHWEVPDDYLNYLKTNDPQRYAEIMASKNEAEAGIMNESYYSTLLENSGEPDWMKWAKENQFLIDRNNDDLDDRLYHAMSPEEQSYRDEINSLQADNLRYENAIRDLDSDLTEQYPDADLSTIMILRSDRWSKIQKQIDANNVTLTKLQGTVNYMQAERQAQDKAGKQTINELKDTYGMFYQYTPEWMSELAQAQYAATNVTLDQADVWTDTQKQMALQSVLDGYYDKYWSIIQRSEAQVIWDTIAYVKNNWVSLSQALEDTFLKYLREKPWFAALNTVTSNNPDVFKIWDDTYWYRDENGNLVSIGWGTLWWTNINTAWLTSWVSSFVSDLTSKWYTIAPNWWTWWSKIRSWWCWTVVNDYLGSIWDSISLSEANDIKDYATSKTPTIWSIAYFDWTQSRATPETKKHWHVAIVVWDDGDKITVLESNTWTWLRYNTYSKSSVTGYYTPNAAWTWSQWYNPDLAEAFGKYSQANWNSLDEKRFREQYWKIVEGKWVDKDTFLKQYKEWYADMSKDAYLDILSNLDQLIEITGEWFSVWERWFAAAWIWDIGLVYDYVKNNLTVNWLQEARDRWLKLWVLSDSDVQMIAKASSKLWVTASQETRNDALKKFRDSILNNNKYLKQEYQNKSAYSKNKTISFNDDNKLFTIWTSWGNGGSQEQDSGYQPKSIKNIGKK